MSTKSLGLWLCALGATFGVAVFACNRNDNAATNQARRDEPVTRPSSDRLPDPVGEALVADHPDDERAPLPGVKDRTPQTASPPVDNTGRNARDQKSAHLTPLDQGGRESDLRITQSIRKAVVADGDLSTNGKNVKIITQAGKVTLRGPVQNEGERYAIEQKAKRAPGVKEIDNQLEVEKH
jgi:hyperosmotically inducible protein